MASTFTRLLFLLLHNIIYYYTARHREIQQKKLCRSLCAPVVHATRTHHSHHITYARMVTNLISSGRAAAAYRCMRRLKTHPASAASGTAALLHIYSNSTETYFLILELSRFLPTYAAPSHIRVCHFQNALQSKKKIFRK